MATSKSAFEEALGFLSNVIKGAKSAVSSGVSNLSNDYNDWLRRRKEEERRQQQKVNRFLSDAKSYFNPDKAASGPNFWTTPTAQGLANVQTKLVSSRPAQDISQAGQAITQNARDFTGMIKAGRSYWNPDQAASGPNFWNTRAARDMAGVQTSLKNLPQEMETAIERPLGKIHPDLPYMNEAIMPGLRGALVMLNRQGADIQRGEAEGFIPNLIAKAGYIGTGQYLIPDKFKERGLKESEEWNQALLAASAADREELMNYMKEHPTETTQDWIERGIILNIPSLIASWGPMVAVAVITKNPAAATAIGLPIGFALEGGSAYDSALAEGQPESKARTAGIVVGLANMWLERYAPGNLLEALSQPARKSFTEIAKRMALTMIDEGKTEMMQEFVQNVGRAWYDENQRELSSLLENVPQSGFFGFLLGGIGAGATIPFTGFGGTGNIVPVDTGGVQTTEERSPLEELFRIERGPVTPELPQGQVGQGIQMISPSVKEGMNVEEALQEMSGERHIQMRETFNDIDSRLGITNNVFDALGDTREWGTENSLFNVIPQATTYDNIVLSSAVKGLVAEQMSVIPFQINPEGEARMYLTKIGKYDINTIRQNLDAAGLDYRTFVDQGDGYLVAIFDEHDTLKSNVDRFTDFYSQYEGKPITADAYRGIGEIIGGDTREQGADVYKRRIREIPNWQDALQGLDGTSYWSRISNVFDEQTPEAYRVAIEEAPYNLDTSQVEETLSQFFDENEVAFLAKDPGTIVTSNGEIATGRYTTSLIEAVEQDGKVQDQTVYHEAFHAYVDMFADEKLHQQALKQIKEELAIKDDVAGEEALAEGFANWMQNQQTGFTGKIQQFFDWLFNNLKGLVGRKNQVQAIYQEMLAKKRARMLKTGQLALSYRDAQGVSVNGVHQPNLTSKIIQTLVNEVKGGEEGVTSTQHIENLTNRGGLKQVERDLARDVANRLAVDGKVNVKEFIKEYQKNLLPLQTGTETSWENIVLPDEVRGDVENYYERIYSSPFETSTGRHFRNFPNYFAHVRVEDMADTSTVTDENHPYGFEDGGTRRIIEIQSDMFQIPTEEFEKQFYPNEPINRLQMKMSDINTIEELNMTDGKELARGLGVDKRHASKIQSFIDENKRRMAYTASKIDDIKQKLKGGDVSEYYERIYSSPFETSTGYFANEKLLLEQGDTQEHIDSAKLDIKREENYIKFLEEKNKFYEGIIKILPKPPKIELTAEKLIRPYKNVWFERILKEEIAKAAADGKAKLQIPTGETVARIEGYVGSGVVPQDLTEGESFEYGGTDYLILEDFGDTVTAVDEYEIENRFDWEQAVEEEIDNELVDRVTYEFDRLSEDLVFPQSVVDMDLNMMINRALSVNEMNKYKENPVEYIKNNRDDLEYKLRDEIQREVEERYPDVQAFATYWSDNTGQSYYAVGDEIIVLKKDAYTEELSKGVPEDFDVEQLSDDQKTIYDRYEREYPKYLKKLRPDLKEVTDENGITWWETKITDKDKAKVEAFRVEKPKGPKIEESVENTEDFWLAMKNLRKFRGYKVEMYKTPAAISEEDLGMEALAKSRGFQPIPAETVERIAPEAMERINHLNDVRAEFVSQMDNIEDALRNYDFYTKRFGKLMYKKEIKSLKSELNKLVKGIDKEIKGLQQQTIEVEKPAPTNQELAMQALEQSRQAQQPTEGEAVAPPPAVPPAESPPNAPPPEPPGEPAGFDENSQKETEAALRNKARVEGLPDLIAKSDKDKFNTILSYMIGQHDVARITGTEFGEKLLSIPKEKGLDVIFAREAGGSADPEISEYVNQVSEMYEQLYKVAKDTPEIDIGYLENYITHIWDMGMDDLASSYKQWKTKFGYANERVIPTYEEGVAMGLKMKYDHPAPIMAQYVTKLYQTIANIEAFKAMRESGLLLPYQKARKIPGYMPVVAPGIKRAYTVDTRDGGERTVAGDYYAPRSIANVLNRVFSPQDPVGGLEKGLATAAKISSAVQDIGLSGGIPYTPLNAWTFGQLYREMATNVGGMLTSPLYSIKRMGSLVGSTLRPLIPGASTQYFKNNVGQIKKMVARNIPLRHTYTIEDLTNSSFKDKFVGEGIKGTWNKAIFDATFRKFMPMLQISMFNNIESAAIRRGYSPEQAADVAADAVKKFYGIVDTKDRVLRSKIIDDVLTTFFFAPHYRETMARAWANTLTASLPLKVKEGKIRMNNPLSLENRTNFNLMLGAIFVITAYDLLNKALTGRRLKENPPGAKDKLLIPLSDGYTIGIPLFPSTGTVVRYGKGFLDNIKEGDFEGAVDQGKNLLSFMIRPPVDAITNEDYFGRQIYADDDTPAERYSKIGRYIALQYAHPWIEALMDEYQKKYPSYQNIATGLELPLRFYKSKSLESRFYYDNLKEIRGTLSPADQQVWDKLHKQGGYFFDEDEGIPVYDKRSAMSNALDRLAHPDIVRAETDAAIKTAQEQGTPISPFYTLDKDQQFVVLLLKTFYPGDPQYKEIRDANREWLQPYWDSTRAYTEEMVRRGIFEDRTGDEITKSRKNAVLGLYMQGVRDATEITTILNQGEIDQGFGSGEWTVDEVNKYITSSDFIQPTPELQAKLDYYNTLPYGTGARSRYVRANPDIAAYFDALSERTNMSRIELGLPPIGGYGGGYGGYGDYQKKISIKIPDIPTPETKIKITGYELGGSPIKAGALTSNIAKMPVRPTTLSSGYQMANLAPFVSENLVPLTLSQIGK